MPYLNVERLFPKTGYFCFGSKVLFRRPTETDFSCCVDSVAPDVFFTD